MRNLLYKELSLSIHKFFYLLPFLLGALLLIPQWIFILVFMYFFWITVPQIYGAYIANSDYDFCYMLPVSKKDIVVSKTLSLMIIESLHMIFAIIFGIIHNLWHGSMTFMLDVNLAFFGIAFLMYGLFNIVFLTQYFKTGYHFGKPIIYGVIVTLVYGFLIEFTNIKYSGFTKIFEGEFSTQLIVLIGCIVVGVLLNVVAVKQSVKNFERIQ